MVYKRFVKKGGKVFGPYYYESYREGDKVRKKYIKPEENSIKNDKEIVEQLNQNSEKNFNFPKLIPIVIIFGIIFLIAIIYLTNFTGKASLQLPTSFQMNETITGNLKVILKQGELLPADSQIKAQLGEQEKTIYLREILSGFVNGSFYLEGLNIKGEGEGYGIPGEKKVYPEITFSFRVVSEETTETPTEEIQENETVSNPEETPVEETPKDKDKDKEKDKSLEEITETPTEIPTPTETPTDTPEQTQETTGETITDSTETEQTETQGNIQTQEITPEATNSEPSLSPESTPEASSDSGIAITGEVVSEDIIEAQVSSDKPYSYNLKKGEKAELIEGSVKVNGESVDYSINLQEDENNKLVVETDYYEIIEGFGEEFIGDNTKTINLDLEDLDLKAQPGELSFVLEYDNQKIISEKAEINIEGISSNETEIKNETEEIENITYENLSIIKPIDNIIILKNSNSTIELGDYFANSLSYDISEVENIDLIIDNSRLFIVPEENFTGTREAQITAYRNFENEFFNESSNNSEIQEISENVNLKFNISVIDEEISKNLSIKTRQYKAVINKPVKWIKTITVDENNTEDLTIELPKEAENITIKTGEEALAAGVEAEDSIQTSDNVPSSGITGNVVMKIEIKKPGPVTKAWGWIVKNVFTTGKVVEEINESIITTEDSKIIDLSALNDTEISVEYYTEAPIATEENISNGKQITISAPDELNYTDILAYTELNNIVPMNSSILKLIWHASYEDAVKYGYIDTSENLNITEEIQLNNSSNESEISVGNETNNQTSLITGNVIEEITEEVQDTNLGESDLSNKTYNIEVDFDSYDLDEDGNIDYIEWIVPHLSNQTYEIIYITKAIRLDSNRTYIEDIYDYVSQQDNNYTTINNSQYVRVTFEQELDSTKDITLYARDARIKNNSIEINGISVPLDVYEKKKRIDEIRGQLENE